jgi:hypothetical protein
MEPELPETPSYYFHRQFFATFEDDRAGVLTRDLIGVENLMWGSDYPHTEGVWPYSRKKVAQNFANIPEGDTRGCGACRRPIENHAPLTGSTLCGFARLGRSMQF